MRKPPFIEEHDHAHFCTRYSPLHDHRRRLTESAHAADMTGAEIKAFLAGKTAYLETTAASAGGQAGQVVIIGAMTARRSTRRLAGGVMQGKWEVKGNTNCTEWKERPDTGRVRYDKTGDVVTVVDVNSGQVRAMILKTVPGNAEKLGP